MVQLRNCSDLFFLFFCAYFRMAIGAMCRAPRVFPDDDITYGDYTIPRGVSNLFPSLRLFSPLFFPSLSISFVPNLAPTER